MVNRCGLVLLAGCRRTMTTSASCSSRYSVCRVIIEYAPAPGGCRCVEWNLPMPKHKFDDEFQVWGVAIESVVEPYPMNNRVSLAKKFPAIAAQWCYEKNCRFGPEDFSYGSS